MAALLVALACGAAMPFPASGASGLYLTWNDCALGGASASDRSFVCDVNEGQEDLYCAFTLPQATGADVLGLIAVIDIQHSAATLPAWWQLGKVDCRADNLDASADFTGTTACADPWRGAALALIQGYLAGEPRGAPNQARIKVVSGVVPDSARALDDTHMYYGVRIILRNGLSTGGGACAGCLESACLVLNSIEVVRTAGAPGGNLFLDTPGPGDANRVRWQGGQGADCALVPVRRITWGRVKSLYR